MEVTQAQGHKGGEEERGSGKEAEAEAMEAKRQWRQREPMEAKKEPMAVTLVIVTDGVVEHAKRVALAGQT